MQKKMDAFMKKAHKAATQMEMGLLEADAWAMLTRHFRRRRFIHAYGSPYASLPAGRRYVLETLTWPKRGDAYVPDPRGIVVHVREPSMTVYERSVRIPLVELADLVTLGYVAPY